MNTSVLNDDIDHYDAILMIKNRKLEKDENLSCRYMLYALYEATAFGEEWKFVDARSEKEAYQRERKKQRNAVRLLSVKDSSIEDVRSSLHSRELRQQASGNGYESQSMAYQPQVVTRVDTDLKNIKIKVEHRQVLEILILEIFVNFAKRPVIERLIVQNLRKKLW
ncbi:hypothetical protein Tco_0823154 [Tanacetum coccineum]|uniref:Uncharacterized protein n=1 Tax=Tanacetum coccineum TaxID=301880 RepID=A0ABQ5AH33_9ASTR